MLKTQPQSELQFPGRECVRRPSQTRGDLIIGGEFDEPKFLGALYKLHHVGLQTVIGHGHLLIVSIEQIERLRYEIQLYSFMAEQGASHPQVCGCIVWPHQRIASYAWKAVVFTVAVLVWIS